MEKHMQKTLQITLIVLLGLALSGCNIASSPWVQGSGNVTTEQREVGAFSTIDVADIGEVVIVQGDADGLTVATDDNLQAVVLSEVRGDTLYLGVRSNTKVSQVTQLIFTVTVKELKAITLSGAGTVSAPDLSGDELRVDHSGAGTVTVGGTVREQWVTLSGVGSYEGAALVSERATVELSGIGSAVVQVRDRLDATVSGAGSIAYIGSPELHERVSGVGSVGQRAP